MQRVNEMLICVKCENYGNYVITVLVRYPLKVEYEKKSRLLYLSYHISYHLVFKYKTHVFSIPIKSVVINGLNILEIFTGV